MDTTKHTPGEWHVCKHGTPSAHPQFGIYAGKNQNDHVIVRGENAESDARLIAAAPELLAALESELGALDVWQNRKLPPDLKQGMEISRDIITRAIAKAKGQQ